MKKEIHFLIAIFALIIIILISIFYGYNRGISDGQDVKLVVYPSLITDEKVVILLLKNNMDYTVSFNSTYSFERLTESGWKSYPSEISWIYPIYYIGPGGNFSQKMNVEGLVTGKYVVNKEIEINGDKKLISIQFDVNRPMIDPNSEPKYGYRIISSLRTEFTDNSSYKLLKIINMGGLTVKISRYYAIEKEQNGVWVNIYTNNTSGSYELIISQDIFTQVIKTLETSGNYRIMKYIYVEGYDKSIIYTINFHV